MICSVAGCAFARPTGEDSNALTIVEMAADHHAWAGGCQAGENRPGANPASPRSRGHTVQAVHGRIEHEFAEEKLP